MQEPNQELNEEGRSEFVSKMNTLGNTSNAKEEVKKNSNAQKDKKNNQPMKTNHVEGIQNEKVHKSGRVNDDSHEIEAVLSARKKDGKWMYEVKCLGHVGFTWGTFNKILEGFRE